MDRGQFCENLVLSQLENKGYSLYVKNYKTPFGEVDLVVSHNYKPWLMVEVKSSNWSDFSSFRLSYKQKLRQQRAHGHLCAALEREIVFYLAVVSGEFVEYFLFSEV